MIKSLSKPETECGFLKLRKSICVRSLATLTFNGEKLNTLFLR